jgi:hypothetical protein
MFTPTAPTATIASTVVSSNALYLAAVLSLEDYGSRGLAALANPAETDSANPARDPCVAPRRCHPRSCRMSPTIDDIHVY